ARPRADMPPDPRPTSRAAAAAAVLLAGGCARRGRAVAVARDERDPRCGPHAGAMMRALILVDLQNDFVPGGALAVPEGDRVLPIANAVQTKFDLVVATQDWHPRDHGSFAATHPGKKPGDWIDLHGLPQILWPVHCVQGTAGAAFVASLDTSRVAEVFQKGIDPAIDS